MHAPQRAGRPRLLRLQRLRPLCCRCVCVLLRVCVCVCVHCLHAVPACLLHTSTRRKACKSMYAHARIHISHTHTSHTHTHTHTYTHDTKLTSATHARAQQPRGPPPPPLVTRAAALYDEACVLLASRVPVQLVHAAEAIAAKGGPAPLPPGALAGCPRGPCGCGVRGVSVASNAEMWWSTPRNAIHFWVGV